MKRQIQPYWRIELWVFIIETLDSHVFPLYYSLHSHSAVLCARLMSFLYECNSIRSTCRALDHRSSKCLLFALYVNTSHLSLRWFFRENFGTLHLWIPDDFRRCLQIKEAYYAKKSVQHNWTIIISMSRYISINCCFNTQTIIIPRLMIYAFQLRKIFDFWNKKKSANMKLMVQI